MPYKREIIQMREMVVVDYTTILSCLFLSSCIAVFVYEKQSQVVAGAHIMLPTKEKSTTSFSDTCFVDFTLDKMIFEIQQIVGKKSHLRAKISGGATVYQKMDLEIGKRNILETKKILLKNGIFLVEEKTGGLISRSVDFQTDNFVMSVVSHDFILKGI